MVQRNLIEPSREVKKSADAYFARALESGCVEMIMMSMESVQQADKKLLKVESEEREKCYRNLPVDKTHPENLGAEGIRKFLISQYEGLTGIKIKDVGK